MKTSDEYKLTWQAEVTHPHLVETLRSSLREVMDPEIGLNIIELGLVRDVIIDGEEARLHMIMTTPFCPYAPVLLDMTRKKAEEALQQPVSIELGMEMWDPTMMEEGAGADWGFF